MSPTTINPELVPSDSIHLPKAKIQDDHLRDRGFFKPVFEGELAAEESAGHELYYEEWGNIESPSAIYVVLHGGPGMGFDAKMTELFDPTTDHVIFFDQLGAGNSRSERDYLIENTTKHVVEATAQLIHFILDQPQPVQGDEEAELTTPRVNIVGKSWGSFAAYSFCATHPEMVDNVVTIANVSPLPEHQNSSLSGRVEEDPKTKRSLRRLLGMTALKDQVETVDPESLEYAEVAQDLYETALAGRNEHWLTRRGRHARKAVQAFGLHQILLAAPRSKDKKPETMDILASVLNRIPLLGGYAISSFAGPRIGIGNVLRNGIVALHYFKENLYVDDYDNFQPDGPFLENMRQINGRYTILNGTEDPSTPPDGAIEWESRIGEKATYSEVPGAGHRTADIALRNKLREAISTISQQR